MRGKKAGFSNVEREIADWKDTEASLYFATGHQANIGVFQTLLREGDATFSDELNHASIIDGIKLGKAEKIVYPHLDYRWLAEKHDSVICEGEKFVVTECPFSMDGDNGNSRVPCELRP